MIVNNTQQFLEENGIGKVIVWDETLRDGEQCPGVAFSIEQKIELARLLDEAGVGIIDLGFPVISEEEKETVRIINEMEFRAKTGVTLRAKEEDIDCALKLGVQRAFMFTPTSQLHVKTKFGVSLEEHRATVIKAVKHALKSGMDVCFISEDTSRSDLEYVIPLFNEVARLGVNKIMITDTVGVMVPTAIKRFVSYIIERCDRDIQFGIHCHNDFGLATANTLAAVEAGVVLPTMTINGIGERAGNASLEEIVMALELVYKIKTGIDLKKLIPLSQKVERYSGIPVAPNKAVVGFNAFRHESGIHVHAMLKVLTTYETFSPELLGRKHEFVMGKHSGKSLIRKVLHLDSPDDHELEELLLAEIKSNHSNSSIREEMYHKIQDYYSKELGLTEEGLLNLHRKMANTQK